MSISSAIEEEPRRRVDAVRLARLLAEKFPTVQIAERFFSLAHVVRSAYHDDAQRVLEIFSTCQQEYSSIRRSSAVIWRAFISSEVNKGGKNVRCVGEEPAKSSPEATG